MCYIIHFGTSVSTNACLGEAEGLKISHKSQRQSDFSAHVLHREFLNFLSTRLIYSHSTLPTGQKEDDGKNNKNNVKDVPCISSFHRDDIYVIYSS